MSFRAYKYRPIASFMRCLPIVLLSCTLFAQEASQQAANLIISVQGKVTIKRSGWSSDAPVAFGMNLSWGDLLFLDEQARVKVVCANLALYEVNAVAKAGVPCSGAQPLLRRPNGSLINPTRLNDHAFPVVLSPRKTKLLSSHPVLRWTRIEGVTAYRVIVRGIGLEWTARTTFNEMIYPENAPALKPGVDYKLIVEAAGQSSSAEPGFGLGFSILDSDEKKEVLKEEKRILNLDVSHDAVDFLIAHLYSTHGLKAEAISRLETLSKAFKQAAVVRLLADLYLETGVARKAESLYLESLTLAKEQNDREGQMLAHLALAEIYEKALGNQSSAGEELKMVLALAKQLGDDKTIQQATSKLAELHVNNGL